mgnify:CR=1 FL=1
MSKTKQKILNKAKELFNEHGMQKTTLRQIATDLAISQGNLNYHFPTKNEIVEQLYFELDDKVTEQMKIMMFEEPSLSMFFKATKISVSSLFEYRFLTKDLDKLLQVNDRIASHLIKMHESRKIQFNALGQILQKANLLREEEFENEYIKLNQRMTIVANNWTNSHEFISSEYDDPVSYFQVLIFEMLYPYLNENGKKEYRKIVVGMD